MSLDPVTAAIDLGKMAIRRIWPDLAKQAEEERKLLELSQNGTLAELNAHVSLMLAQINVNLEQAKSKSFFVAGARPFIMWMCGVALGLNYLVPLVMEWVAYFSCSPLIDNAKVIAQCAVPERPDGGELVPILLGLLGLGSMRSFDKKNGVSTEKIR